MLKSDFLTVLLVSLALSSVIWAAAKPAPPKPAPTPVIVIAGEKEAGKTLLVKTGDQLEVRLVSNPTTGFEWSVANTDPLILPVEGASEFIAPNIERQGAPGLQIWRFRAKKAGKVCVELHYSRPWEKVAPTKTWSASIEVR